MQQLLHNSKMANSEPRPRVALAFSGGLDTTWCVPHLIEQGYDVETVTIDVGGSETDADTMRAQSLALGAKSHAHIYAIDLIWDEVLRHLLAGNVLRGGTYPLCVGAERSLQARLVAEHASKHGIGVVAHGCTAAGNDQVRFEVTLRACAPGLAILAPVRDLAPSRAEQVGYLWQRGHQVPTFGAAYSVNSGLWGVTIGVKETTGTSESIPETAWVCTKGAFERALPPINLTLGFTQGIPTSIDGMQLRPVELITKLHDLAAAYGIGRGIHLGESVLGIKGRVAFEAPAATVLIAAHRELEKLVLTKRQIQTKEACAQNYGDMVHEGLFADPSCRDIEALLDSSQKRVTGQVRLLLRTGSFFVEGVTSPFSLHAASRAVYGEATGEWTPEDARGFCRVYGLATILAGRANGAST